MNDPLSLRPPGAVDEGAPPDATATQVAVPIDVLEAHATALPRLTRRPGVAVVVPIYSGGASLAECLDALAIHGTEAEVVLVDDSCGDQEVGAQCESFLDRWDESKLVVNERNMGFVASANAGMATADPGRDIVLLNSDTAVTARWLEKLSAAAYVFDDVATVVPLSNAADVFSLPEDRVDSPLPPGWSPDLCARLLERVAPRMYERVPATSGFCQYVRRTALDEVGSFDSMLFHRGYGEDNDFCERASAAGFSHLIDDATFIYHERTVSFAARRQGLSRINKAVLRALHPEHVRVCVEWEQDSRIDEVRSAYASALSSLEELPVAEVDRALRAVPTKLTVSRSGPTHDPADANGNSRAIWVSLGEPGIEVEMLGARWRPPDQVSAPGVLSWLVNRWSVSAVEVVDDALDRGNEAALRKAWRL